MNPVKYLVVTFTDVSMLPSDIPKLRGYFSAKFLKSHLFHNHLPDSGFIYKAHWSIALHLFALKEDQFVKLILFSCNYSTKFDLTSGVSVVQ